MIHDMIQQKALEVRSRYPYASSFVRLFANAEEGSLQQEIIWFVINPNSFVFNFAPRVNENHDYPLEMKINTIDKNL